MIRPLEAALYSAGLTVWRDEYGIREGESITEALKDALSRSCVVLAFCTDDYLESDICQWEMSTAWLAGTIRGSSMSRLLVWLASEDSEALGKALGIAGDGKWIANPKPESPEWSHSIKRIISVVRNTSGEIGRVDRESIIWYPEERRGSNRVVGRMALVWQLANAMHRRARIGTTGHQRPEVVQLVGLTGIGKSIVAMEYAQLFGPVYQGGIFWLSLDGEVGIDFDSIASWLGIKPGENARESCRSALSSRGPYLWVLDGVPEQIDYNALEAGMAPTQNGHTVITTTCRKWEHLGVTMEVTPLSSNSALALLTDAMPNEIATGDAHLLVKDLGGHPLALALLAALAKRSQGQISLRDWRTRIQASKGQALDLAERLHVELPTNVAKSIFALLNESIELLSPGSKRLLALVSVAQMAVPLDLCGKLHKWPEGTDVEVELLIAADELVSKSLASRSPSSIVAHALICQASKVLLDESLVEEARRELLAWLITQLDREIAAEDLPFVEAQVDQKASAKGLETPQVQTLAARYIDFRFDKRKNEVDTLEKILGDKITFVPHMIPAMKEPDDPWAMQRMHRGSRSSNFEYLSPLVTILATRLAEVPSELISTETAAWACEMAARLVDVDRPDVSQILSFIAQNAAMAIKDAKLGAEAAVMNSRACYRLGDFRGYLAPQDIANIAAGIRGPSDLRKLDAVGDVAAALYAMGKPAEALATLSILTAVHASSASEWSAAFDNILYISALAFRSLGDVPNVRKYALVLQARLDQSHGSGVEAQKKLVSRLLDSISPENTHREAVDNSTSDAASYAASFIFNRRSDLSKGASLIEREKPSEALELFLSLILDDELSNIDALIGCLTAARDLCDADLINRFSHRLSTLLEEAIKNNEGIERIRFSATLGSRLLPQILHDNLIVFVSDALPYESATGLLEGFDWDFAHSESDEKRINYGRRAVSRLRGARALHVKANGEYSFEAVRTDVLLAQALAIYDPNAAEKCLDSVEWLRSDRSIEDDSRSALLEKIGQLRAYLKSL